MPPVHGVMRYTTSVPIMTSGRSTVARRRKRGPPCQEGGSSPTECPKVRLAGRRAARGRGSRERRPAWRGGEAIARAPLGTSCHRAPTGGEKSTTPWKVTCRGRVRIGTYGPCVARHAHCVPCRRSRALCGPSARTPLGGRAMTARRVILVVEDQVPVRRVIAEILDGFGYDARLAGRAADAYMLPKPDPPDPILLHLTLPAPPVP